MRWRAAVVAFSTVAAAITGASVAPNVAGAAAPVSGGFVGVTPARVLDTRFAPQAPCIAAGATRTLTVAGADGIPRTAGSVVLNVTVLSPSVGTSLTVFPGGITRPGVTSLSAAAGQTSSAQVTVKLGTGGRVSLFNAAGCVNVLAEVVGYFVGGAPVSAGGFAGLNPVRLLDTRQPGKGPCVGALKARVLKVTSSVVGSGLAPAGSAGALVTITMVNPAAAGAVTIYPGGSARPALPTLNFAGGRVTTGSITTRVSAAGEIQIFNNSVTCVNFAVDLGGYVAAGAATSPGAFTGLAGARLLDTRTPAQAPCVAAASTRSLELARVGGVPAGASAVLLNILAVRPPATTSFTVFPFGSVRPAGYTMSANAGLLTNNVVAVPVGLDRKVSLHNATGCSQVLVDVVGYFGASTGPAPLSGIVSTPVGRAPYVVGTGANAGFSFPTAIATNGLGSAVVADTGNNVIRQINMATGAVTLLAGSPGEAGSADGTGSAARFSFPTGVTFDSAGNVVVADSGNHTLRRITLAGVVTTLAGSAGATGTANGTGAAARFNQPAGLAADALGNVFVADSSNHAVRRVTSAGVVTTLAGSIGVSGINNGTGSAAGFNTPSGLALDGAGSLYVSDSYNYAIRKITVATGAVTTLAGSAGLPGTTDATGSLARFFNPTGLTLIGDDLYVVDTFNHAVRKVVVSTGVVSTVAGVRGASGYANGTSAAARFNLPGGLASSDGKLLVADTFNQRVRQIDPATASVTSVAGNYGSQGAADGLATDARFGGPDAVAVDSAGVTYVADGVYGTIRKVTTAGVVSTLAGTAGLSGAADGVGPAAAFSNPAGLAIDASGNVLVADTGNHTIRKVTPAGVVSTIAGLAGNPGAANGARAVARFNSPRGVAVDASGNVLVADTGNHTIRRITPAGVVTTVAGTAGLSGSAAGVGAAARFSSPSGIAVDTAGKIYVADTFNHAIRRIALSDAVSALAGTPGVAGTSNGAGAAARFTLPTGIALDSAGQAYVADAGNNTVRRVTAGGVVSTLAGTAGRIGTADGTGGSARFSGSRSLAVNPAGSVVVADLGNHTIRVVA